MDKLTIKQAAKILKVSEQTVRRRINKGEISAQKEMTEFGEIWFIPADAINTAINIVDVVPITRTITPAEVGTIIENAVSKVVTAQVEPLKNEVRILRAELGAYNRRLDERLREASKPKSFWSRLFNK